MEGYSSFFKFYKPIMKIILFQLLFLFYFCGISGQSGLTGKKLLETDTISGLEPTTPDNFNYLHAVTNTQLIQESLNNSESGQKLVIPEGTYDVETLFLPTGISDIVISGAGIHKTILRRAGFQWDNNTQGNCPLRTEILVASNVTKLTLTGPTLAGFGCWLLATRLFST